MRTNEEILQGTINTEPEEGKLTEDFRKLWFLFDPQVCQRLMLKAMKEAQKEIVEHILQRAADKASLTDFAYEFLQEGTSDAIDKKSILSLKDELIKEIDNAV